MTSGRLLHDRRAVPRPPRGVFSGEAYLPWHRALRRHLGEYLIEAFFLALFITAAGVVATVLDMPAVHRAVGGPAARRAVAGAAMGLLAMAMIYSPWGRRSGTHLNPAMTLAFWRLRKVGHYDLLFYVLAQFAGGAAGIGVVRAWMAPALVDGPGTGVLPTEFGGLLMAFAVEFVMAATAMLVVLLTINHIALYRWAGVACGLLAAVYAAFQSPLSALGMNPARTAFAALAAGRGDALWVSLLAPVLGMLLAVDAYRLLTGRTQVACAKLAHNVEGRCIFRCQHPAQARVIALKKLDRELHERRA
ncbi:MAG TPA: aquaporin [Burkholderiaceae bacterium]